MENSIKIAWQVLTWICHGNFVVLLLRTWHFFHIKYGNFFYESVMASFLSILFCFNYSFYIWTWQLKFICSVWLFVFCAFYFFSGNFCHVIFLNITFSLAIFDFLPCCLRYHFCFKPCHCKKNIMPNYEIVWSNSNGIFLEFSCVI